MNHDTPYIDPDIAASVELSAAHVRSGNADEFMGQPLRSFSGRLVLAAQSMGLRLFTLSQNQLDALTSDDDASLYDGVFMDAATVLWLRLQNDSTVTRATLNKRWAVEAVMNWVDSIGLSPVNGKGIEMVAHFAQAMRDMATSAGIDSNEEGGAEKK